MHNGGAVPMMAVEWPRYAAAAAVLLGYAGLCVQVWRQARCRAGDAADASPAGAGAVLVAYASQTGFAHELAEEAGAALAAAGVAARVRALGGITAADLTAAREVLFIVSTCREGDAPDNAQAFVDGLMSATSGLHGLRYGLLALGDRSYAHYCAFGRRLDAWLHACGAQAMFPRIEVDAADAQALAAWRHRLAEAAGIAEGIADSTAPAYWRLRSRRLLNPGSAGQPAWHVELEPVAGPQGDGAATPLPHWQAGDLLQIFPPGDDARPRLYSIASLPADGAIHLLVRAIRGADGTPGRMSGLLAGVAAEGTVFRARVRAHDNFRLGANATRPLILIGNGTGLAGLLAHLRQRARAGDGRNWLVFGERSAAHDAFHDEELAALEAADLLARCDRVYSRDTPAGEYVQHRLLRAADTVREWVAGGAAIYVCGNAVGMGPAVHETLCAVLGDAVVAQLARDGRYRRDIY